MQATPSIAAPTAEAVGCPRHQTDKLEEAFRALNLGEPGALDRVVPMLYDDLRRVARQRLRSDPAGHTLGTTGVVHETYLRLLREQRISTANRGEFLAAASNAMRRLLVDYARARKRQKRGGGQRPSHLDDVAPLLSDRAAIEMLELDDALRRLDVLQPRAGRAFQLKVFAGLSLDEIADQLSVSSKTVQRDLHAARAWLSKELGGTDGGHGLALAG